MRGKIFNRRIYKWIEYLRIKNGILKLNLDYLLKK